ncbi:hypothetical protein ABKV19_017695, partial [Rosa sericea]
MVCLLLERYTKHVVEILGCKSQSEIDPSTSHSCHPSLPLIGKVVIVSICVGSNRSYSTLGDPNFVENYFKVPLLGGAFCACTWHLFYNTESLE